MRLVYLSLGVSGGNIKGKKKECSIHSNDTMYTYYLVQLVFLPLQWSDFMFHLHFLSKLVSPTKYY